jgi:hypothetical protein
MPDDVLLAAAEAGELSTPEGIAAQAERLLAAPVARAQVTEFFSGWLNLFAVLRLQREAEQFPAWNTTLPQLFSDETRAFASKVVFDGAGDLATLLTASYTYGDPSLAAYYGGTAGPMEGGLARIELPPDRRAGLLTQASFLATHSKEIQTDPSRAASSCESACCARASIPAARCRDHPPTITPGTTARDRFAEHEANPICAGCHVLIDPVGLAFENYDPIGQWRDTELGKSIDASGDLTDTDVEGPFVGVVEMAENSRKARSCRNASCANGSASPSGAWSRRRRSAHRHDRGGFAGANGQVRSLLVALTQTPDFRYLAWRARRDETRAFCIPSKPLSRRTILRGGRRGTGVAVPGRHAPARRLRAKRLAKRFVVFFSANGTIKDQWQPAGSETSFTLSPILKPLEPHQSDLLILRGLDNEASYLYEPNAHDTSMATMLTGDKLLVGPSGTGRAGHVLDGTCAGPSIDQEIARVIGGATKLPSLELGVQSTTTIWSRCRFACPIEEHRATPSRCHR